MLMLATMLMLMSGPFSVDTSAVMLLGIRFITLAFSRPHPPLPVYACRRLLKKQALMSLRIEATSFTQDK